MPILIKGEVFNGQIREYNRLLLVAVESPFRRERARHRHSPEMVGKKGT